MTTKTDHVNRLRVPIAVVAAVALALSIAPDALATSATATLNAGSLAFVSAPASISFSGTLNGLDQTISNPSAIDVGDATGSGTGWNITATSTTFATAGNTHLLSTSATTVTAAPADACDSGATCALATNSVTYPYTLPAAATAPTATKVYNAAASTGLGNQTVTPTWKLAVPANTFAGTYNSTWTLSLVSGP